MLSLFFGLISCSQFVPFVSEETLMLFSMNLTEIAKVVEEAPRVVVYLHERMDNQCYSAREKLAEAIRLFPDLIFIQLNSDKADALIEQLNISAPHLLFYNKGDLWSHCHFPASETALLYLLNLFEEGERAPVSSMTNFLKSLGTSHYTLLYPKDERNQSTHAHRFASTIIGFIDLLPFTPDLAAQLGLNNSQMYLFRLEDVSMIPVSDNISEIVAATVPDYSRISPEMMTSDLSLLLGVVLNRVTPSITTYLEKVSEAKKEGVKVGFFDRALHDVVNSSVSNSLGELPSVVAMQPLIRQYYEVPKEITAELIDEDPEKAAEMTIKFLDNLPEPKHPSEPIPAEQNGILKKLVGFNHDEFIAQPDKDVVVLYISPDTPQTKLYIRIVEEAATAIRNSGLGDTIEFAVINTTKNYAENYPYMAAVPHIHIYPSYNKSANMAYYSQPTMEDVLRFIKRYGGKKYKQIDVKEATRNEVTLEVVQIYALVRSLDEDSQAKAFARLEELLPVIGSNLEETNRLVFGENWNMTKPEEQKQE